MGLRLCCLVRYVRVTLFQHWTHQNNFRGTSHGRCLLDYNAKP